VSIHAVSVVLRMLVWTKISSIPELSL